LPRLFWESIEEPELQRIDIQKESLSYKRDIARFASDTRYE